MAEFSVIRDGTVVEDSVFDVGPLQDTANPFGDFAVVKMDDRGGELFDAYSRGTRLDITISEDNTPALSIATGETVTTDSGGADDYTEVFNAGTYENAGTVTSQDSALDKFTGYVVESRESEQSGADVLEVEAYTFDQFLRRNNVSTDQTGNSIAEALESIVTNDTPVSYVAANVDVGDEQELTRSYRGRPVESALRDLAFKSNNEEFGVNDDLEFFFRPQESTHIDRGIDDTQWFNYDIPELGKEAVNEVEVWFDDGNESVVIDDSTDKLDLQDSLDLPEPGTQRAELQRPLITDISDAEDIGRKYLKFRNATLSGTVTTFGLYDAQPGDTIDVTITPRGIDTEFVIASTNYRWGRDETQLTIVERRGDVDDILTEINDSVQRQEMAGADRDAVSNRITTTNATAVVSVVIDGDIENTNVETINSGETLTINSGETETATTVENAGTVSNQGTFETTDSGTVAADGDRFVNPGRRAVRDAWSGDGVPDIDTLLIGDDNSGLSRSNTALRNQTATASISQSLPDAKTIEFTASGVSETTVREIGLEAADGTLITRAAFDSAVNLDGEVTVTLDVSNDDNVSRGVLTNDGQTAVRDVLADNSPDLPTDYAYGSDNTDVAESDTALANELVSVPLNKVPVQNADTQSEWDDIISPETFKPTYTENGKLKLAQTAFVQEGEADPFGVNTRGDSDYSDGEATYIAVGDVNNGDSTQLTFDLDYTLEEQNIAFKFRTDPTDGTGNGISDTPRFEVNIDGTSAGTEQLNTNNLTLEWRDFGISWTNGNLTPGSHTFSVEVVDDNAGTAGDQLRFDAICIYDERFPPTFDNNNGGNSGYLDGPELYPSQVTKAIDTATARRKVDKSRFELTANDVSNNFFVELSGDGGSTYSRVNNSQTGDVTFSDPTETVDANVGLGRTSDTRTTATPQTGFNGQDIDVWELFVFPPAVSPDDIGEVLSRAIVDPGTITGQTVREAGLKNGSTLLTRHLLAEFTPVANVRIASAETTLFTSDN